MRNQNREADATPSFSGIYEIRAQSIGIVSKAEMIEDVIRLDDMDCKQELVLDIDTKETGRNQVELQNFSKANQIKQPFLDEHPNSCSSHVNLFEHNDGTAAEPVMIQIDTQGNEGVA